MDLIKNITLSFLLALAVFVGGLFTIGVIRPDLSIYHQKLIFDDPTLRDFPDKHQSDARYLPYTLRKVFFNNSIYIFRILKNVSVFWNLNNINNSILIANLYPVVIGFGVLVKMKKEWWLWLSGLVGGSLAIGINKMVDARSATYFMLPIFAYLMFIGIKHVNLKIYGLLLFGSLLLVI